MFSGEFKFKFGDGGINRQRSKPRERLDHQASPIGLRAHCPVCDERIFRDEPHTWRMGRYLAEGHARIGIAHVSCLA